MENNDKETVVEDFKINNLINFDRITCERENLIKISKFLFKSLLDSNTSYRI